MAGTWMSTTMVVDDSSEDTALVEEMDVDVDLGTAAEGQGPIIGDPSKGTCIY